MSATEELRNLLDERGVGSYTHEAPAAVCLAFFDGKRWHDCWESTGGEVNVTFSMTPEQAIAATLGRSNVGRYVGLRQGEYWERTENSNYYCGGCGWKVTDHDSYCPECGGALHKTTLGTGTCQDKGTFNSWGLFTCSNCSIVFPLDAVKDAPSIGRTLPPKYCPNCGKKIVDPTTNDVDAEDGA